MKKLRKLSSIGCLILSLFSVLALNASAESSGIYLNTAMKSLNNNDASLSSLNADFIYNGGAYKILDNNTVTFMGVPDSSVTNFDIPSLAIDEENKKSYTISQIGYPNASMPGANSGLQNIETIESVPGSITVINNFAFYGGKLKYINLSNLKGLSKINYCTFTSCSLLKTVKLPCYINSIEGNAFAGCISLTDFTIYPDGKGECWLKNISSSAFLNCKSLRTLNIPFTTSLEIENNAFASISATSSDPLSIVLGRSTNNYYYSYITIGSSEIQQLKNKTLLFTGNLSMYILRDTEGNDLNWDGTLK